MELPLLLQNITNYQPSNAPSLFISPIATFPKTLGVPSICEDRQIARSVVYINYTWLLVITSHNIKRSVVIDVTYNGTG